MPLTKKQLDTLRNRDTYCWHCGTEYGLVPHHRKNRKAGGSKLLNRLDNLIMVCAIYNSEMESVSKVAMEARQYGHKLASWANLDSPCFDKKNQVWYSLTETGEKLEVLV